MVTVSLRFEENFKKELDKMCDEMGMNLTTFFMIYAKKALRERRIPFEVAAPLDPFYSKQNLEQIEKSAQEITTGKTITKTIEEARELHKELIKEFPSIRLCDNKSCVLSEAPIIMPLVLTKGLEFDSVIVFNKDNTASVYSGGGLKPLTTDSYALGDESHIWANLYTDAIRLYRNTEEPLWVTAAGCKARRTALQDSPIRGRRWWLWCPHRGIPPIP